MMRSRVFLLFAALVTCLPVFSQETVRKVAILETVDKEKKISYGVKLMVRSNLAVAITNTPGYEGYDRVDIASIMGEQEFQRTGMVNDDQIRRLGEMTGATDVLIAEVAKIDENNVIITAKILDVESAKLQRTSYEQSETNPQALDVACRNVAAKLLGIAPTMPSGAGTSASANRSGGNTVTRFFGGKSQSPAPAPAPMPAPAQVAPAQVMPPASSGVTNTGITYEPCAYNTTDIAAMSALMKTAYFSRMYSHSQFNVVVDFSCTMVAGIGMLNYMAGTGKLNGDFYQKMSSEVNRFIKGLNSASSSYYWSFNPSLPVTLVVKVKDISPNGRDNVCDFVFVETASGTVLAGIKMNSKGGVFGSFTNLFGDAMEESAAPKLVKMLKKAMK